MAITCTFSLADGRAAYESGSQPRRRPGKTVILVSWFHWSIELMDSHADTADDVPGDLPLPSWSWDGPVI